MILYNDLVKLIQAAGVDDAARYNPLVAGAFSSRVAEGMAAIAIAESGDPDHPEKGANPQAHNSKPPDDSYGLWQINMLGQLGPVRRKQFGITDNTQLFDPMTNAKAAVDILKHQGPTAWSTYSNGKYLTVQKNLKSAGTAGVPNTFTPLNDAGLDGGIAGGFNTLSKSIFGVAANAGVFLLAIVFIILGIIILLREPISSVAKATPIGRVASKL